MATISQTETEVEKGRILHLTLPDDLHAQVKSSAALSRTGYSEYVIQALREAVKRSKKELSHAR